MHHSLFPVSRVTCDVTVRTATITHHQIINVWTINIINENHISHHQVFIIKDIAFLQQQVAEQK